MSGPWLSIVGIGEDGLDGLAGAARAAFESAEVLIGGTRHLAMIPDDSRQRIVWPSPFSALTKEIENLHGTRVCVLATGDPMHYGVGVRLAAHFSPEDMVVYPAPSAFSLAAARMGWGLQEVECLSLHGRPAARVNAALAPGQRIIALSTGSETPAAVAQLLTEAGYGASPMTIFEHMGGRQEKRHSGLARDGAPESADLNTIAIECRADAGLTPLPRVGGLPDDAFVHDGTMTKRDIRASALAKLAPLPGQLLWDVGAGAGSVAIEWMRAARGSHAIAIEKSEKRRAMLTTNADKLGTPELEIIAGEAPDALASLPAPDAIFIGGGLQSEGTFEACWRALKAEGRLVAHGVTLASEARLIGLFQAHGGALTRLSVSHAAPLGAGTGWTPNRPVTQWSITKDRTP